MRSLLRAVRFRASTALLALGALGACTDATAPRPAVEARGPRAAVAGTVGEARALWVNRFEFDSPTKIAQIMDAAAGANFNVVYFQARGAGDAFYHSTLEPCAVGLCGALGNGFPSWDPLQVAVREAHARGLELHAWVNALPGWGSGSEATCALLRPSTGGAPDHVLVRHPEWRVAYPSGGFSPCPNTEEYVYLSPGNPGVRTHLARVAADIARRYEVDGIHLDRIRYPGTLFSYDSASLASFGRDPDLHAAEWEQFRRGLVDLTVREAYDSIQAVRPSLAYSAAVWGIDQDRWGWNSSQGYSQYYQDPRAWARGGYLDVAVPMTYFNVNATYCGFADWACLLDDHLAGYAPTGRHLYIGIGANRPIAEIERQIALGRQRGVHGFALYAYTAMQRNGHFAALAAGAFREKAPVPRMAWK